MNYRHAYHAGNHGDVLKHALLARVLTHFKQKDAAFTVLDAHAGIGLYDLSGLEAFKTGEWRGGIGQLLQARVAGQAGELLAPYLSVVREANPTGELLRYPGSPELARQMMRPQDQLLLNELHPQDHERLAAMFSADGRVRVSQVDAGQAVKAALPFPTRRGVVLIDPAFEVTDETERVARMVVHGLKRMAQACIIVWYPVTTQAFAEAFCAALPHAGAKGVLRVEQTVRKPEDGGGLAGSGVVIYNPPWKLEDEAKVLAPVLADVLGEQRQGRFRLQWLAEPA